VADWWLIVGSVNIVLRNDDAPGCWRWLLLLLLETAVHGALLSPASCVFRVVVEWFAGRESRAPSALLLRAEIIILTAWAIAWGWLDDGTGVWKVDHPRVSD
jgi:hypothetical protein